MLNIGIHECTFLTIDSELVNEGIYYKEQKEELN